MNYLKYLVEEIHTTVVATVDDTGLPVTAAIDMMNYDEDGLYFLTAKGKGFYDRLKKAGNAGANRHEGNRHHALRRPFHSRKGAGAGRRVAAPAV